jgi:hypothetical protein
MADDIAVTPGSGVTVRADDVGGKLFQVVKQAYGGDGYAVESAAPVVTTAAASSLVLKNGAGQLFEVHAAATTVDGWLLVFDATSAPSNGTVQPKIAFPVPAQGMNGIQFAGLPPVAFSTGITAVFSTGANPFTLTASATAYIFGRVA